MCVCLCVCKGQFIVGFYADTQDTQDTQEPLAELRNPSCMRASPNFSNYPTELRKPHVARKAVIGLLTPFRSHISGFMEANQGRF